MVPLGGEERVENGADGGVIVHHQNMNRPHDRSENPRLDHRALIVVATVLLAAAGIILGPASIAAVLVGIARPIAAVAVAIVAVPAITVIAAVTIAHIAVTAVAVTVAYVPITIITAVAVTYVPITIITTVTVAYIAVTVITAVTIAHIAVTVAAAARRGLVDGIAGGLSGGIGGGVLEDAAQPAAIGGRNLTGGHTQHQGNKQKPGFHGRLHSVAMPKAYGKSTRRYRS